MARVTLDLDAREQRDMWRALVNAIQWNQSLIDAHMASYTVDSSKRTKKRAMGGWAAEVKIWKREIERWDELIQRVLVLESK